MGLKNFLANQGLIELEVVTEAFTATSQPKIVPGVIPQMVKPDGTVDGALLDSLIKQIDTVEGFSFIEFFETNENTNDLSSAVANATAMMNLTKETLILQGNESVNLLATLCDQELAKGEEMKAKVANEIKSSRESFDLQITETEQKLIDLKKQRSELDGTSKISEIDSKLSSLSATRSELSTKLNAFIKKLTQIK